MKVDEVREKLIQLGHTVTTSSYCTREKNSREFTFMLSQSKWYRVDDQKGYITFWPSNGIGEKFVPKNFEEIENKFGRMK